MRIIAICSVIALVAVAARDRSDDAAARRVWAQAVAAKGGEAALRAIRTFVVSETMTGTRVVASGPKDTVVVCQPPARWWEFLDYRPGELGVSVHAANLEKQEEWYSSGGKARRPWKPNRDTPFRMAQYQYLYFLETSFVQPRPVAVTTTGNVDVVQTEVLGQRVDFYFDRHTHLPMQVDRTRANMRYRYTLDGYEKVGGVLVPTKVALGSDVVTARVEVNIDVDPLLFETPPDDVTVPDFWKRYVRQGRRDQ